MVYSGTAWDGLARGDRLISVPLSEHADILWVDPPVSPLTRSGRRAGVSRVPRPVLRTVDHGIHRLTPTVLPLHTRPLIRLSTDPLVRAQTRWALKRAGLGMPYAVIACGPADVFRGWPPQVRRVFFGTDDFVAGARLMGLDPRALARDERRRVAEADVVAAISEVLAERWRAMGATVTVIPNGVQTSAYRDVPGGERPVTLPSPVAGVVGHLSERIDMALLEALADDGFSLLLVGTVSPRWEPERFAALQRRPNVRWVGPQPFEAVPSYLRCIDVGITPYRDTEFNRASFPLKTLEYLAAGLPVVSTDLPAVRWLGTDLIRVAGSPRELVAAARAAVAEAHVPSAVAARRAFAERHSWANRAADMARAIGLPTAPAPRSPSAAGRVSHSGGARPGSRVG